MYAPTPDAVSQNLTNFYTIRDKPVPVWVREQYGYVDYRRLRAAIFGLLNSPVAFSLPLVRGLAELVAVTASYSR